MKKQPNGCRLPHRGSTDLEPLLYVVFLYLFYILPYKHPLTAYLRDDDKKMTKEGRETAAVGSRRVEPLEYVGYSFYSIFYITNYCY